ncbi:MAG: hypothetical protein Q9225_000607 [Loekoesia sp. 1 TL-2023]
MISIAERPEIQVFKDIHNYVQQHHDLDIDQDTPTQAKFAEVKARYPFMKNINYEDYVHFWFRDAMDDLDAELRSIPAYTATEVWHKLYHDPLTNETETNAFCKFLNYSYFAKVIDIGKLDGKTPLRLAPGTGLIDEGEDLFDDLDFADHGSSAVIYTEGHHPSSGTSSRQPSSKDDGILRRFWEVGYILMGTGTEWVKTGHVMVIDVDKGRDRHPWIILAKEWETDEDDPQTIVAPDRVRRDDRYVQGVFPGNRNRTTIAKMVPIGESCGDSSTPLLLQMGADFSFRLQGPGNPAAGVEEYGPDLAHAMTWFKRPSGEEVCFDKQRRVCMTYDPRTRRYSYPNPKSKL